MYSLPPLVSPSIFFSLDLRTPHLHIDSPFLFLFANSSHLTAIFLLPTVTHQSSSPPVFVLFTITVTILSLALYISPSTNIYFYPTILFSLFPSIIIASSYQNHCPISQPIFNTILPLKYLFFIYFPYSSRALSISSLPFNQFHLLISPLL